MSVEPKFRFEMEKGKSPPPRKVPSRKSASPKKAIVIKRNSINHKSNPLHASNAEKEVDAAMADSGVEMTANPMVRASASSSQPVLEEQPPPEWHAVVKNSGDAAIDGLYTLVTYKNYNVTKIPCIKGSLYFKNTKSEAVLTRQRIGEDSGWMIGIGPKALYGIKTEEMIPPQSSGEKKWRGVGRYSVGKDLDQELQVVVRRPKPCPKGQMQQEAVEFEVVNKPHVEAENNVFDVGTKDEFLLSWALKEEAILKTVPRMKVTHPLGDEDEDEDEDADEEDEVTEYTRYPKTPRTGWHCCMCWNNENWEHSVFQHHGVGIVLYFKFLRWLIFTFLAMALVITPSMYIIRNMGKPDPLLEKGLGVLGTTTLGNLGEGTLICGSTEEREGNLTLACAEGTISNIITAYYGLPSGQCGCPTIQTPDLASGECAKPKEGTTCKSGEYCLLGRDKSLNTPCCAATTLGNGVPNFQNIMPRMNETCNSIQAKDIVNAKCLGKKSCQVSPNREATYRWTETSDTSCRDNQNDPDTSSCTAKFPDDSEMVQCLNTSRPMRLIVVAACDVETVSFPDVDGIGIQTTYKKADLKLGLAMLDWLAITIFMLSIWFLRKKEKNLVDELDDEETTISDYTVYIEGLPPHTTEELPLLRQALVDLFEAAINDPRTEDSGSDWWSHNKDSCDRLTVFDVGFGLNNHKSIELMKLRGNWIRKYELAVTKDNSKRRKRANSRPKSPEKSRDPGDAGPPSCCDKFLIWIGAKEVEGVGAMKVRQKIRNLEKDIANASKGCSAVSAFVTFTQEEGFLRTLEHFPDSVLLQLCQDDRWKLKWPLLPEGEKAKAPAPAAADDVKNKEKAAPPSVEQKTYQLKVRQARAPTEVIWENLYVSKCGRRMRGAITSSIALVLIIVTFAFTVGVKNEKARVDRLYPPVKCDETMNYMTKLMEQEVVRDEEYELPVSNKTHKEGLLSCYCESLLKKTGTVEATVWDKTFTMHDGNKKTLCFDWMIGQTQLQVYTGVAVGGVIIVNMMLTSLMRKMSSFESHHFRTDVLASLMTKLFALKLLNTGIVVLIVNANLEDHKIMVKSPTLPLFSGAHGDFGTGWYFTVGVSIIATMAVNSVSFVIWPVLGYFSRWKAKCCDRGCSRNRMRSKKKTQHEYDQLFIGPQFALADRYAACLNDMFVILMYCGGMPVLLWIGVVGATLRFYVDRWAFARLYRLPPEYDATVAKAAERFYPYAGLMHACFAMWMFTNQRIFGGKSSDLLDSAYSAGGVGETTGAISGSGSIFARVATIPQFVILFALILLWLVVEGIVWKLFSKIIMSVFPCLAQCSCAKVGEDNENLDDIIDNKTKFSGLKTYEMNKNPIYIEAFAKDSVVGAEFTRFSVSSKDLSGMMKELDEAIDDNLSNTPMV